MFRTDIGKNAFIILLLQCTFNPYPAGTENYQPLPPVLRQTSRLTKLYTVGCSSSSFHLDIPKMIMDCPKNGRWTILLSNSAG